MAEYLVEQFLRKIHPEHKFGDGEGFDRGVNGTAKYINDDQDSKAIYQKALTLLQGPLLPVRAHGHLLLRQLASSKTPSLEDPTRLVAALDTAPVPGVLPPSLQSIQDEDSYMFLNAVQGLAAMVEGFGKGVLRGLVADCVKGLDGVGAGELDEGEVGMRVRIGEALGQVVRRCGEALLSYGASLDGFFGEM
jgi:hypothetical protein